METPDVNILVNAFRSDVEDHLLCRNWIERQLNASSQFALIPNVMSGFLRIVTHPRLFKHPSSRSEAMAFCQVLIDSEMSQWIGPGVRHWDIFRALCEEGDARGNLIPDAWLAAVAIENGCEWVSLDRDFARFSSLKWKSPT